jgi:hypothetical protein
MGAEPKEMRTRVARTILARGWRIGTNVGNLAKRERIAAGTIAAGS